MALNLEGIVEQVSQDPMLAKSFYLDNNHKYWMKPAYYSVPERYLLMVNLLSDAVLHGENPEAHLETIILNAFRAGAKDTPLGSDPESKFFEITKVLPFEFFRDIEQSVNEGIRKERKERREKAEAEEVLAEQKRKTGLTDDTPKNCDELSMALQLKYSELRKLNDYNVGTEVESNTEVLTLKFEAENKPVSQETKFTSSLSTDEKVKKKLALLNK